MQQYTKQQLEEILKEYGINKINDFTMNDSSHGDEDIRHNYIIDKRYVLRINSAAVMSEERLMELNSLIKRYNDYGIKSPYFIAGRDGKYLRENNSNTIYLSEYLDMDIADDYYSSHPDKKEDLKTQRLILVARFAERFKNQGDSEYYSMYSMFDLAPYDIPYGIDEKQQNFNELINYLKEINETELIEKLEKENNRIRSILLPIYKKLPYCIFQGDENFTNVCLDDNNQICGLFDFNMSGKDVNANYLANTAMLGRFVLDDNIFEQHDVNWIFAEII